MVPEQTAHECRDDARTVYVAMVQELGPQYVKFAISVLRSALPPRGYMAHVQGYTVHAVLQAVMQVPYALTCFTQSCCNGACLLDHCLRDTPCICAAGFAGHLSLTSIGFAAPTLMMWAH